MEEASSLDFLRVLPQVTLFFINSSSPVAPVLLPEVHVDYGAAQASLELLIVGDDGKNNAARLVWGRQRGA